MRCPKCGEKILSQSPTICPYCGNKSLISDDEWSKQALQEIEKLEKDGRYEEAAEGYEELEMWEKAEDLKRKARLDEDDSADPNMGKVSTVNMECPHCRAIQPVTSKSNEATCKGCGRNYSIPRKVQSLFE
jgi:ribosomal protein S27E/ribosomal protein L32